MEWLYGRQVIRLALLAGAVRKPTAVVGTASALRALGLEPGSVGCRVEEAAADRLEELTGSPEHQGIAARVGSYPYVDVDRVLGRRLVVALDEVTDPRNLGAVARTALAAEADGMVIGKRRAAAVTPAAVKASAGACEHLPIARVTNLRSFLVEAQERGAWVYGASGDAERSYDTVEYPDGVVVVVGSEGRGLRRLTRDTCDELVAIPVRGPLESLNVSVAAGILLYQIRRRQTVSAKGGT